MIGFCCMWIFGVHGMLSGTASMDFGGTKGAATVTGLLDGVQYLASGLTGFGLGYFPGPLRLGRVGLPDHPLLGDRRRADADAVEPDPGPQPRADDEERALGALAAVVDRPLLFFVELQDRDGLGAQEFRLRP